MLMQSEQSRSERFFSASLLFSLKFISAFFLSFTLATIVLVMMDLGTFSFLFVFFACQTFFWKLMHKANLLALLIFDGFFISMLILLRLYIIVVPNL